MAALISNSNPATVIPLQAGVSSVGRGEANSIRIEDPSVSTCHCELRFEQGALFVKDLGATNGTFVENCRVEESAVLPGQTLRLGSVEFCFQGDEASSTPEVSIPVPVPGGEVSGACAEHRQTPAKWICQKCRMVWCAKCVKSQMVGMRPLVLCPSCDGFCIELRLYRIEEAKKQATFSSLLRTAFSYPLRGDGILLILSGGVFFSFFDWAKEVYFLMHRIGFGYSFMVMMVIATVVSGGYLFSWLKNVITTSASGETAIPSWPDVTSIWDDLVVSFFQCLAVWVAYTGPAVWAALENQRVLAIPLLVLGLFLIPMVFLAVAMTDSLSGLNPLVVIPAIAKVPKVYSVAFLIMLAVVAVKGGFSLLLAHFLPMPLPTLLGSTFGLYFLAVAMRVLGILYFTQRKKLAWFGS